MSNESNEASDELKALIGMDVMARLPVHGVTYDPSLEHDAWSGNPGVGLARVVAAHADGSLDLECVGPFESNGMGAMVIREPERVNNVPREPEHVDFGEQDRNGARRHFKGPSWWPQAEQPQAEKKPLWQLDVTPLDQSRFPDDEGL